MRIFVVWQCLLWTMALEDGLDNGFYGEGLITTGPIRKAHRCWTSGKRVTLVPQGTSSTGPPHSPLPGAKWEVVESLSRS